MDIGIVVFEGVQSLDVTGPLEVFSGASARAGGAYTTVVIGPRPGALRSSSGLTLVPDVGLRDAPSLDTLVVAGGSGTRAALEDRSLVGWIARRARRTRRVASVCSGAFLLAEAGVLDGRRATTHWSACALLAERYPSVEVDPDPIHTRDGNVYTSAGVTAGMDLALALVEEDLGRDVALDVARQLVLFLRRPGSQAQFSAQLSVQIADRDPLRELQGWMADHPGDDLSVAALALRARMSERHFARSFRAEVGQTPARYVEIVRLEAARRRLEESPEPVGAVAAACGFGTAETMRRAFLRRLGVGPAEYRRRFSPHLALAS
jgi:transcriptional regulator GlxA family with amidase domain